MAERVLTLDDLTPHARQRFEDMYVEAHTRRERCSREDFAAGWLAALLWLGVHTSFADAEAVEIVQATRRAQP